MTGNRLAELARAMDDAWRRAGGVPAPSTLEPSLTTDDAYAIQDLVIQRRVDAGRRIAGWKMGLTSAVPPTTPIVGTLLDDMVIPSGSDLSLPAMVAPMVEAEVVVRIGETLDQPQTATELAKGPHEVGPGIEVIDYRTTAAPGSSTGSPTTPPSHTRCWAISCRWPLSTRHKSRPPSPATAGI
jgi:2-oxo-hept-3-ene-1,7-dioate hydratase